MPNRIIKESICTSETIDQMSLFEEVFFYRLLTACDDYGRMDARPKILKSKLFPLKDRLTLKDIESALHKLADIGCVRLYECDSKPYLYLPTWEAHQQVRAKRSKYPAPDKSCNHMISHDITCPRNPIQSESESKDRESDARTREDADFDRWWAAYPRKTAIAEAFKAWIAVADDRPPVEEIIAAVERQKAGPQWQEEGGKYIPSPARWLRQHGWLNQEPEVQDGFTTPMGRQEGKRLTFWDVGEQMKRDGEV